MKSAIRIIKQKRDEDTNETTAEITKSVEFSTGKIASTVKKWIAESQQRKRDQRRSLPALTLLILSAFVMALAQSPSPTTDRPLTPEERAIKVESNTTSFEVVP